ncbi:uncharacterized protein LOC106013415, partial [Aplysia californica]|uniref:Uncharacterized protein LOC106013415 n=1 Tax=Aplysia californica TaxID=6500 RepID=A0ABM1ABK0_APLCA
MMSSHAFLLSLVAAAALCLLLPGVISVPLSGGEEEIVTVQLVHHSYLGDRSKRSAESDMPDDMTVRFDLKGDNVELRMKRSSLLPAVTLSGLQLDGDIRGAAVYTDATRGSSMVVKRSVDNYKLTGSFVHNGKDWNLEPLHRHRRDAG